MQSRIVSLQILHFVTAKIAVKKKIVVVVVVFFTMDEIKNATSYLMMISKEDLQTALKIGKNV